MGVRVESLLVCVDCLQIIAGNECDAPTSETLRKERRVESMSSRYILSPGNSENDLEFSRRSCDTCGEYLGGSRHEVARVKRPWVLPAMLSHWHGQTDQRERVYAGIGVHNERIPPEQSGTYTIDGFTFEVKAADAKKGVHRIFLRAGATLIPFGRVAQTSYFLLSHSGGEPEGLYCRQSSERAFDLYEVAYWENLDSSAIPTHGKYNVRAGHVDLDLVTADNQKRALAYFGLAFDAHGHIVTEHDNALVAERGTFAHTLVQVESCWAYGEKEVTIDVSGNNLRDLIRAARGSL